MKKLMMFAAAMTIVAGAYAQCGFDDPNYECDAALVYQAKFNVKTTKGKPYSGKCDDVCYRQKGSANYKGYLYACGCTCDEFMDAELLLTGNKKNREVFEGFPEWVTLNKIGKKNLDAEGYFHVELDDVETGREFILDAAGFGKFDKKGGYLKNMSGNFVGLMSAPLCEDPCEIGDPAVAFPACDWEEDEDVETIAFGKWSIKYNKKLSKKYWNNEWDPEM